ncbi:MAG: TonB-dependent receptor [Gemmatimonadota bacterium]
MNIVSSKRLVLSLFLSATLAAPSAAQTVPGDTADVVPLQPVVVNVLRTPFPVTQAPFALGVKTEDEVQRARPGLGLDEALGGIPGVQVDNRYNFAVGDRVSIRGFGARTPFGVRGVTVLVDGIPATLPDGTTNLNHVDLGYLRRVEVVRGPSSSLYGNAAGGVIQFESEAPPPVPISQEVGVTGGSDGLLRFHSTTGGQSGGANYLLNVTRLTYEGYREFQDANNLQINGSLGGEVAGGDLRLVGSFVDYEANNPGSLTAAALAEDPTQAAFINVAHQTGEDGRQAQLGASWNLPMGQGELRFAGYGLTREIDNPIPGNVIDIERIGGGLSALYSSAEMPSIANARFSLGAEADVQNDDRQNFDISFGSNEVSTSPSVAQDEQIVGGAVFTQLTAQPADRLTALAGLRYDVTRFEADDRLISATNPDDSGSRTMSAFSPSVGLTYEIAEALSLYTNVSTSFETPTATELANQPSGAGGFNPELEPQRTVSYEAGMKGLLPGTATYQFAVYRANIDDALIPFTPANQRVYFRNAGSAVHQGLEAGLTLALFEGMRANVAYTYIDASFDEYVVETFEDGELVVDDYSDNQIPGVAPHRIDGSLMYTSPLGAYATVEARYSDEVPVNDSNSAHADAYTLLDLRTGLEAVGIGNFVVEPFVGVTNLLDEVYVTSPSLNHVAGRYYEPGPGRAFYAGAQIRVDVD